MINTAMRFYDYFLLEDDNEYGQPQLSQEPVGKVKMAVEINSQTTKDNILFANATYIGFTHSLVADTFVISYEGKLLKVLYVNPRGRLNQVYLADYVN